MLLNDIEQKSKTPENLKRYMAALTIYAKQGELEKIKLLFQQKEFPFDDLRQPTQKLILAIKNGNKFFEHSKNKEEVIQLLSQSFNPMQSAPLFSMLDKQTHDIKKQEYPSEEKSLEKIIVDSIGEAIRLKKQESPTRNRTFIGLFEMSHEELPSLTHRLALRIAEAIGSRLVCLEHPISYTDALEKEYTNDDDYGLSLSNLCTEASKKNIDIVCIDGPQDPDINMDSGEKAYDHFRNQIMTRTICYFTNAEKVVSINGAAHLADLCKLITASGFFKAVIPISVDVINDELTLDKELKLANKNGFYQISGKDDSEVTPEFVDMLIKTLESDKVLVLDSKSTFTINSSSSSPLSISSTASIITTTKNRPEIQQFLSEKKEEVPATHASKEDHIAKSTVIGQSNFMPPSLEPKITLNNKKRKLEKLEVEEATQQQILGTT